ncbi:MAG: type III secretion system chaperone [Candidatus Competibacteraceae bacterium]
MSHFERMRTLMTELGPLLELEEVTEFTEDQSFGLLVDDDTPITADYDEAHSRILLSAEVAAPPEDKRHAVYEMLLQYNLLWFETGGLHMALDGPAGSVVQMMVIPATDLNITTFGSILSRFIESLKAWRMVITEGLGAAQSNAATAPPDPLGPDGGIIPGLKYRSAQSG